jgi:hypothetical protein
VSDQPKAYRWRVVDAVEASDLPPPARHLMLTLCLRCGEHRAHTGQLSEYSPSLSELARLTGWKATPVKKYLGELERLGWLIRDQPPVKLQRSEKARTKYTVRIPGEPPDLFALSRPPHDLENDMSGLSRSPDDHGLGRQATWARSPRDHITEGQKKQNGADAADGRKPSARGVGKPRATRRMAPRVCEYDWPIADDGTCCSRHAQQNRQRARPT